MIPDLSRALVPLMPPVRRHRREACRGAFEINAGGRREPAAGLQPRTRHRQKPRGEGGVEKDDVERLCAARQERLGLSTDNAPSVSALMIPLLQARLDRLGGGSVAFDEGHLCRPARQGFKTQCTAACEQVEAAGAGHHWRKPVEQSLADAVGRRSDGWCVGEAQPTSPPRAADDAQHSRGCAAPVCRGRTAHALSFEPADRAATIH